MKSIILSILREVLNQLLEKCACEATEWKLRAVQVTATNERASQHFLQILSCEDGLCLKMLTPVFHRAINIVNLSIISGQASTHVHSGQVIHSYPQLVYFITERNN